KAPSSSTAHRRSGPQLRRPERLAWPFLAIGTPAILWSAQTTKDVSSRRAVRPSTGLQARDPYTGILMKPRPPRPTRRPSRPLPSRPKPQRPSGPPADARGREPERRLLHVAPLDVLADAAAEIAEMVEHRVLAEHKRADRALALALRDRRELAPPDQQFI